MISNVESGQTLRSNRLAEAVSSIFHPFIVVIPTMFTAILYGGNSLGRAIFWTALSIGVVVLPLVFLIYSGVKSGRYSDLANSMREQPRRLYSTSSLVFILFNRILVIS